MTNEELKHRIEEILLPKGKLLAEEDEQALLHYLAHEWIDQIHHDELEEKMEAWNDILADVVEEHPELRQRGH